MAGFIRRFTNNPGLDTIRQIEGVAILDLPPPGSINGVGSGTVCVVGEYADMTYAVSVNGSGVFTTNIRPQEVFSAADMQAKVGGFDPTIGDFGASGGNGYAAIRGKQFQRLLVAPVNLCSNTGLRLFRSLPLCTSATNTIPFSPMLPAVVPAGTEFRSGAARVRTAGSVQFTNQATIATGVNGSTVSGTAAATQVYAGPAGTDWTTVVRPDGGLGVHKGDILVIGHVTGGSAIYPASEAGTYRVAAEPVSGVNITIERLDGAGFAFSAQTAVPYRVHYGPDADSAPAMVFGSMTAGGYVAADAGGYTVPARPLTNATGGNTDGTWTASQIVTPLVIPTAMTATSWDVLSGLGGRCSSTAMVFTAAVQAPNAASSAAMDTLYTAALAACISDATPISDIDVIITARTSSTIRSQSKQNALTASARGKGRDVILSPELTQTTLATVLGDTDPGVGANRAERVFYSWPGFRTFVPEAVGYRIKTADGSTTTDGILDIPANTWLASVCSILAPERNPAQSQQPVPSVMASVLGFQRAAPTLGMDEYIQLRSRGVCAGRIDRTSGPIFQSGITTSLVSGEKNINRRRMADYIEDSLAQRLNQLSKLPATVANRDAAVSEVEAFLSGLKSDNNPSAQRINDYQVDDKSGNTPETNAAGVFIIIVRVRLTPTDDFLVLQCQIGENVGIQRA